MKWWTRADGWAVLVATCALGIAGLTAGCEGLRIDFDAGLEDIRVRGRVSRDPQTLDLVVTVPDGYVADIKVERGDGSVVRFTGVDSSHGPVDLSGTADARHIEVDIHQAPPPAPPGGGGGSGGGGALVASLAAPEEPEGETELSGSAQHELHYLWHLTTRPALGGSGTNLSASFEVWGPAYDQDPQHDAALFDALMELVQPVIEHGPGTAVPRGVNVRSYVEMRPEALGGRLVVGAVASGFAFFDLRWNQQAHFATETTNSLEYDAGAGWRVLEVFVPQAQMSFTPTSCDDEAAIRWRTAGSPDLLRLDARLAIE